MKLYQTSIPFEKKYFKEDHKEYEIQEFPIYNITKYYYKGKLHRENVAAIEFLNDNKYSSFMNTWFFHGEKIC